MVFVKDNKIRLTRGDYGVVLPVKLIPCCKQCCIDLLDTDIIHLEIQRNGDPVVVREVTWAEIKDTAVLKLELTQAESDAMPVGVYAWTVILLRARDMRATLIRSVLEVIV